ncbi:hypothetical protein EV179_003288 [Coemansia sp. RSA 487]|nr:hypothetical protein EV179_003288 [Coemansia sp. RSA 487]
MPPHQNMIIVFAFLLLFLESSQCVLAGVAETSLIKRISNGYTAQKGAVPYAALLTVTRPDGSVQQCGATIISPEYLITAAHCLEGPGTPFNSSVSVKIGFNSEAKKGQKNASIKNVYINSMNLKDNVANPSYDIAVIQVASMSGDDTKRIPIYTGNIYEKQPIIATGWGQTDASSSTSYAPDLQGAKLYVGSNSDCKKFSSTFDTSNGTLVCTLSTLSAGTGICNGDAGTPAYVENSSGTFMAVGLASRIISLDGKFCGGSDSATMFVHISQHLSYIMGVTGLSKNYLEGNTDSTHDVVASVSGVRMIGPTEYAAADEYSSTKTVFVSETYVNVFSFVLVLDLVLGAEELGLLDKRIYKGYTMPSGQAPYAAHFMMTKGTNVEYLCGATFISPEYLVTAAHCLESGADPYKSSYVITIGYDSEDEGAQKQVKVINAYPHPKYIINASSEDARYDMAVLQVTAVSGANTARALIYTKDVNPGDTVLAVGWGGSEDAVTNKSLLRGANLIVGDSETCKKYMGAFTNSNDYMVCTLSGKTPGVGICGGDSGSSIMAKDGDVEKFIGIKST